MRIFKNLFSKKADSQLPAGETSSLSSAQKDWEHFGGSDFQMAIDDVFSIEGRGVVAVGIITRGTVQKGKQLTIVGGSENISVPVLGIEDSTTKKQTKEAGPGQQVGMLLGEVRKDQIQRGYRLEG